MKYVAPSYLNDSFTCPHCGTLSLMHCVAYSYNGADFLYINK